MRITRYLVISFCLALLPCTVLAEGAAVKVGVVSILSGDLMVLGRNVVDTVETYRRHYLRHNIEFIYEDAKLSSADGLRAYQKLINIDHVGMLLGACSSNGTMAAKTLINSSRTPAITIVTGGRNVDRAGEYIFRIGNSDTLNGVQEAEAFIAAGIQRAALLTEETEYTQDISRAFRTRFAEMGGTLVFDQNFLPAASDFRSEVSLIKRSSAQGILMPTQTGTALGIFVKQWRAQGGSPAVPIHTSFVAAPNPDALRIAGEALFGVSYMAPLYDRENPRLREFFAHYAADHGRHPAIPFHTAGAVDALDMLQTFLDQERACDGEKFARFLLSQVKNYQGLMGNYSFDSEGNSNLGFRLATITRDNAGRME